MAVATSEVFSGDLFSRETICIRRKPVQRKGGEVVWNAPPGADPWGEPAVLRNGACPPRSFGDRKFQLVKENRDSIDRTSAVPCVYCQLPTREATGNGIAAQHQAGM